MSIIDNTYVFVLSVVWFFICFQFAFQCNLRVRSIDRRNVIGFVGPLSNADAIAAATLANDLDMTIISPSANAAVLSVNTMYRTFLRTVPSIEKDVEIMSYILTTQLGVRCVAVISEAVSTAETTNLKKDENIASVHNFTAYQKYI